MLTEKPAGGEAGVLGHGEGGASMAAVWSCPDWCLRFIEHIQRRA
jgi:hypothetical protein